MEAKATHHNIFEEAKSSTWKPSPGQHWRITYGDGSSASGHVGTDVVNVGGITIQNQAIELAHNMSSQFQQSAGDGLMGLAWGSINTVKPFPVKTPVENMIAQSSISPNSELFTAYLESAKDTNGQEPTGSFYTFGYVDQEIVQASGQTIHYTPVDNSNGFWQIASNSYSVNGETFNHAGNSAIMDTGTTLCLVDDQTCKNIYAKIPGAKYDSKQGGYVFPTATPLAALPVVEFDIGGQMFQINKEDLPFAPVGNGTSYGAIQSAGDLPFAIYGDVMLRCIYAIFNVGTKQFGCVQRSTNATTTSTMPDTMKQHQEHVAVAPPSAPHPAAPAPTPATSVSSPAPVPKA